MTLLSSKFRSLMRLNFPLENFHINSKNLALHPEFAQMRIYQPDLLRNPMIKSKEK